MDIINSSIKYCMQIVIMSREELEALKQDLIDEIKKMQSPLSVLNSVDYLQLIRTIVKEEIERGVNKTKNLAFKTDGLIEKPLYKMNEVCELFQITRPTVYEWIKRGLLKPHKLNSLIFFLAADVKKLLDLSNHQEL